MNSSQKAIGFKRIVGIIIVILTVFCIFILSSQEGKGSNEVTKGLLSKLKNLKGQEFKKVYVKLKREGSMFTANFSENGNSWQVIGESVNINLNKKILLGLGVTSHNQKALCNAVFSNLKIAYQNNVWTKNWTSSDIGNVGLKGSYVYDSDILKISGSGNDIWRGPDSFYYVYQQFEGDFEFTVMIDNMDKPDLWAKAGIVIRESIDEKSKYAAVTVNPEDSIWMQWRDESGFLYKYKVRKQLTNPVFRKILHFMGYFVLAMVLFWTLKQFINRSITTMVIVFNACFIIALADELHQYFVPGRTSEIGDVIVDSIGSLAGVLTAYFISNYIVPKKSDAQ